MRAGLHGVVGHAPACGGHVMVANPYRLHMHGIAREGGGGWMPVGMNEACVRRQYHAHMQTHARAHACAHGKRSPCESVAAGKESPWKNRWLQSGQLLHFHRRECARVEQQLVHVPGKIITLLPSRCKAMTRAGNKPSGQHTRTHTHAHAHAHAHTRTHTHTHTRETGRQAKMRMAKHMHECRPCPDTKACAVHT